MTRRNAFDVYRARGHHCNVGSYRHSLVGVADDELLLALSHNQSLLLHLLRSLFVQITEALLDDGGLRVTRCEIERHRERKPTNNATALRLA